MNKINQKNKITLKLTLLLSVTAMLLMALLQNKAAFAAEEGKEATARQTLMQYIDSEINTLDQAVNATDSNSTLLAGSEDNEGYFFRRFWLRLRPRVERDIPIFASFSIVPEIQMLWEKQTPQGWEIYKPK